MAYGKQTTTYVDVNAEGKAIALDVLAICDRCNIKGMKARYDAYKAALAKANDMRDDMLQAIEEGMDKAGTLEAGMALQPWFNFGQFNVVRVMGKRHGVAAPKAQANSSQSVAALFGANVSKITRRK